MRTHLSQGLDIYLKTGAKLQLGGLLNSLVKVAVSFVVLPAFRLLIDL